MNSIQLDGFITNIKPSHKIQDIEYNQADLILHKESGNDIIQLKFKKFSNPYKDGDNVKLSGNIRSYSQKLDSKNKVSIYVFTYFDIPESNDINHVEIDGRICKIDPLRSTKSGKLNFHFILANNLIIPETNQKLNSYIPCIAWNSLARRLSTLSVNTQIKINGELHSREYKKEISEGIFETHLAHELLVKSFEVL